MTILSGRESDNGTLISRFYGNVNPAQRRVFWLLVWKESQEWPRSSMGNPKNPLELVSLGKIPIIQDDEQHDGKAPRLSRSQGHGQAGDSPTRDNREATCASTQVAFRFC